MSIELTNKRIHIQALRGYAVLLVVLYHSGLGILKSGFLGVDVFFVISGFLITGLIVRECDAGIFRLRDFYLRRAKRLLPAAYTTLIATALIAPYLLTAPQLKQLQEQLIGAITFSANIVLWMQSGYFDADAITKPLLHFWSLAIEEQYYLLIPCLLILLPAKTRIRAISLIVLTSLIYCLWFADKSPSLKFYLLHTRAWELGIGSIGALASLSLSRSASFLLLPAILTLLIIPFIGSHGSPPDLSALAVCISTLIIILGYYRTSPTFRIYSIPVYTLAFVGDFSYSLYLIHWPIIVFMRSGYFQQQPPAGAFVITFVLSLVLGYLLYRFVEQPFRNAKLPVFSQAKAIAIGSSCVLALPLIIQINSKQKIDFSYVRRPNYGFAQTCDQPDSFKILSQCKTSDHPKMIVWGDSHAMHLVNALKNTDGGIIQATRSACPPFTDIAPFFESSVFYTQERAQACIGFNDSVMRYLEDTPSVEIVVLAGALSLYRSPSTLMMRANGKFHTNTPSTASAVATAASKTISRIRSLGKKVIIVESPPYAGFDIGSCLERHASGMWSFGKSADCTFSKEQYQTASAPEIQLMDLISTKAKITSIGFANFLCLTGTCQTSPDGVLLYVDGGHLTYDGTEYLEKKMHLSDQLILAAR